MNKFIHILWWLYGDKFHSLYHIFIPTLPLAYWCPREWNSPWSWWNQYQVWRDWRNWLLLASDWEWKKGSSGNSSRPGSAWLSCYHSSWKESKCALSDYPSIARSRCRHLQNSYVTPWQVSRLTMYKGEQTTTWLWRISYVGASTITDYINRCRLQFILWTSLTML